jgi:hypothetical protein
MIGLDELVGQSQLLKEALAKPFDKKTTTVLIDHRRDQEHTWQGQLRYVHASTDCKGRFRGRLRISAKTVFAKLPAQ